VVGPAKMKQMLQHSGLRQAQLDLLQEGFANVEGGGEQTSARVQSAK
jgi:hypothetical protein